MKINIRKPISLVLKILLCTGILLPAGFEAQVFLARTLAAPNLSASIHGIAPAELQRFAEDTIKRLAKTKPFAHWEGATSIIEPLGPGTHSWLVTVRSTTQDKSTGSPTSAGYLIISATEQGEYKLIEYGSGEDSIFSRSVLESGLDNIGMEPAAIPDHTIVPLYAGPTLAEWGIAISSKEGFAHFINALNGEDLPETQQSFAQQAAKYTPPSSAAGSRTMKKIAPAAQTVQTATHFDPYDNVKWMTRKPMDITPNSFARILSTAKRLIYVSSGGERTYSVPLPVFGYQIWEQAATDTAVRTTEDSTSIYVQSGTAEAPRWIALEALLDAGEFIAF